VRALITTSESKPGVWSWLTRIVDTLPGALQGRLELFAVDLQQEGHWLIEVLILSVGLVVLGMMALTTVTLTIIVFWRMGASPLS
jgi:uncharacterized membrane protein YqjE